MSIEQHKAKGPFDNLLEQQPGTTVQVRQVGLEVVIVGITAICWESYRSTSIT